MNNHIFDLMQIAGGTFPSGGFSQSWGLETYVTNGKIKDADSFREFVEAYLYSTAACLEGPIVREAHRLAGNWRLETIKELEALSHAARLTKEARESSLRMGKAFLRIISGIAEDRDLADLNKVYRGRGVSYPVIYGLVCGKWDIEIQEALAAFVWNTTNGLVQSAVKLIPLGNTEAQKILREIQGKMEDAVNIALNTDLEHISNFCPGIDMSQMAHENLPVRLYMS